MNFLKESQDSRNIIALLLIMFGRLAVKYQPIITLDTGTFIPKNFPAVYENFLRKHKCYEKLIQNKCKLYLDLIRPTTQNQLEVDVKKIKIVPYKSERDKNINSLMKSYVDPNMHTFE